MSEFNQKYFEASVLDDGIDYDQLFQLGTKKDLPPMPQPLGSCVLNLGCGRTKFGFCVDKNSYYEPHLVLDLDTESFPINTEPFSAAFALHFLEHISNLKHAMDEIWTVLKPGAPFYIIVPYFKSDLAFQDFDHKIYFTEKSFEYFTDQKNEFLEVPEKSWKICHQEIRGLCYRNLLLLVVLEKQ